MKWRETLSHHHEFHMSTIPALMTMKSANKSSHESLSPEETISSSNPSPTKFRPTNQNLIRDVILMSIPLFVLYMLSTHPMIASIGYFDPNAPKQLSQEEILANMIYNMALNQYKERYSKRKQLLDLVDPDRCHDFTQKIKAAEEKITKSNTSNSNKRAKKKQRSTIKRSKKNHGKKKKIQFSKKLSSIQKSSTAPFGSSIISGVMLAFNSSRPNQVKTKGTENIPPESSTHTIQKVKKRKFGKHAG
jgi:hypothetical protein